MENKSMFILCMKMTLKYCKELNKKKSLKVYACIILMITNTIKQPMIYIIKIFKGEKLHLDMIMRIIYMRQKVNKP